MVAEIWASVISPFVDQLVALIKGPPPAVRHNIALSTTGLLLVVIIPAEYINFLI